MSLLLVIFGAVVLVQFDFVNPSPFTVMSAALIAFGVLSFVIGIIGLIGTIRNSTALINTVSLTPCWFIRAFSICRIDDFRLISVLDSYNHPDAGPCDSSDRRVCQDDSD